jgi:homogentisate 1,2-dioxygenase
VQVRIWACDRAMSVLARNSDGDELIFVHQGEGELFCDFGHLSYREGDYIVLPRGTMWRIEPKARTVALLIEATDSSYKLPDRGLLGPHAQFDPAMLDVPKLDEAFRAQSDEREWKVVVKRRGELTTITYPFNPLDAAGWKGNLSVVRINWRDIRPVMSHRYHVPPSVHSTFVADRFVVCTFVPRPIESDPGALKVPFFHSNDDFDEVIFYHQGEFFSRDNIHPGMVTFHPCGFTHGPHPKAFAAGAKAAKTMTDEVAVMIDARDPLEMSKAAEAVEDKGYADSWKSK